MAGTILWAAAVVLAILWLLWIVLRASLRWAQLLMVPTILLAIAACVVAAVTWR